MTELSVSIACVCFPAIRHLVKHHFPSMFSSGGSGNSNIMRSLKVEGPASTPVVTTPVNSRGPQPVTKAMSFRKRLLDWFDEFWVFEGNESSTKTGMRSG